MHQSPWLADAEQEIFALDINSHCSKAGMMTDTFAGPVSQKLMNKFTTAEHAFASRQKQIANLPRAT
eukprot:SAG31_NODE_25483_length_460_cov_1.052632_2_plen_66_part_01